MTSPFRPHPRHARLACLVAVVFAGGCAGKRATPGEMVSAQGGGTGPASALEPAPFSAPAPDREPRPDTRSPFAGMRASIFDAAWTTVRDKHFDPKLGGHDWNALRERYRPMALHAPDEPTFYRVCNELLGQLGQSHLLLTGPGDDEEPGDAETPDPVGGAGFTGLTVREIEGRAVAARVRPGSAAARAGLRPGYVVTHIAGRALEVRQGARPLRPVEARFQLRRRAAHLLSGPPGTPVTVRFLDLQDRPGEVALVREAPATAPVRAGNLTGLHPEVRVSQAGDVGVVAFDFFLLGDVLDRVTAAIERFRAARMRGLVLDLRGNVGGVAAMAIPVARALLDRPVTLGTLHFRDFENTLTVAPSLDSKPFTGPVVVLTDEATASTSEILIAGLREAGRIQVAGGLTLGAALPSAIESLPGGAVLQYVVADFRTPAGRSIEGRGVEPDRPVLETRRALAEGRDPVLEAGLELVRRARGR